MVGARRPRRPGDGPETWRRAAGAQSSPGGRGRGGERARTRVSGRREGNGEWKFRVCLVLDQIYGVWASGFQVIKPQRPKIMGSVAEAEAELKINLDFPPLITQ